VRRIEAVTGIHALAAMRRADAQLQAVCEVVRGSGDNVAEKVSAALRSQNRELEKEVARLKQKLATSAGGDLTASAVRWATSRCSPPVSTAPMPVPCAAGHGPVQEQARQRRDPARGTDDKVALVAGVTKDLTDRVRAGDLMREFAGRLGGKGGGRPDMAQGGGTDLAALPAVMEAAGTGLGRRGAGRLRWRCSSRSSAALPSAASSASAGGRQGAGVLPRGAPTWWSWSRR
jgi:alanyl-tRNA synthetase